MVSDAQLIPYKIPLKRLLKTASSNLSYRQGFLIKLIINNSESVIGESAPMVEIGTESYEQSKQFLQSRLNSMKGSILDNKCFSNADSFPASRFALESAFLSILDKHRAQTFYQQLNPDYSRTIKTNIMLGSLDDSSSAQAREAELNGFKCLKFKMGLDKIEAEAEKLHQLIQQIHPDTQVRLDANKSWTQEQTHWFLDFLCQQDLSHRIDSIEEPLATFNTQDYQLLQNSTNISLALDESFLKLNSLMDYPVQRLILKPMVQGGIINTWRFAQQAKQYKIEVVITSSIESGYGLWPITYLCAALNNEQFHGLATANWLSDTLVKPPEIHNGIITI